jgi:transposase
MFFRRKVIKQTPLLQLVESYRDGEGRPRQRIVASLGKAELPEGSERIIARCVEEHLRGQRDFFDDKISAEQAEWVARIVKVAERTRSARVNRSEAKLDGVIVEQVETLNVVEFGPEWVGMEAWRALGLTEKLQGLGLSRRGISTAQAMVINRIIDPMSEWAFIDWVERTALPECLNLRISKTTKDRLYKTSDELLSHRKPIEEYLRQRGEELLGKPRSIVLYDLTNTHFEGLCGRNPKAARGKNKQKRSDCLQVAIGMAFDEYGYALAHEVFEGAISDSKTLFQILQRLEEAAPARSHKPLVILDAGLATKANLKALKEQGYSYLVNITRGSRTQYATHFETSGFEPLPGRAEDEQVEVKCITDPQAPESQLVLCRSMRRREKEKAILSKAEKRFIEDTVALQKRVGAGRLKDPDKIQQSIGRLLQKHPRVSRFYQVEFDEGTVSVERKDAEIEKAYQLHGNYVLKTDQSLEADVLWAMYMTLLKAEAGFKMLKGTLGLRPNFHQKEDRVDGHIFITVLAYHLLCWIHTQLEKAGDRRTWRRLRGLLRTHCVVSTRFPLEDGRIVSIRKASLPDEEQIQIYTALGLNWRTAYKSRTTEINA